MMSDFNLTYKAFGNKAILIEWPHKISEIILYDILSFKQRIKNNYTHFIDISTAYNSLTIYLNNDTLNIEIEIDKLKFIYFLNSKKEQGENNIWHIPVCYNADLAPDLESFLKTKKLSLEQLLSLHTQNLYTVYFIGFLPGFPYLGGLDETLHTPRKAIPENVVKKGSVGIGGQQTGIYTINSPGGWHIIGKTPLSLFNVNLEPPCFLKAGDKIKFVSVTKDKFHKIENQIKERKYKIKKEVLCLEFKS